MSDLRILILEDLQEDAELMVDELKFSNLDFEYKVVENKNDFLIELNNFKPNLILSDFSLPSFSGLEAIELSKSKNDLPIIIVTGSINEQTAVSCMKAGAADYVLKTNLRRLPHAVKATLQLDKLQKEKRETEEEIRRTNDLLFQTQKNSRIGSWEYLIETDTLLWSEQTYKNYGLTECNGKLNREKLMSFIHPDFYQYHLDQEQIVLKKGYAEFEYKIIWPNKEEHWIWATGKVDYTKEGIPFRTYGLTQDITERKQAEEEKTTFRRLATRLTNPLSLKEVGKVIAEEAYLLFNFDAFSLDIVDHSKNMLVGVYNEDTPINKTNPVEFPTSSRSLDNAKNTDVLKGELKLINRSSEPEKSTFYTYGDETRCSLSIMFLPIIYKTTTIGIISVQSYTLEKYSENDLNKFQAFVDHASGALVRAQIEEALKLSEEKYRLTFDNAPLSVIMVDAKGMIISGNKQLENMLGYSLLELKTKTIKDISFPEPDDKSIFLFKKTIEGKIDGFTVEKKYIKKDGSIIWGNISVKAIRDGDRNHLYNIAIIEDITKRKTAETELIESERKLNTLFNNIPGMAYRCWPDEYWTMKFLSAGCKELTGYETWELIDNKSIAFADIIFEEDKEHVREAAMQCAISEQKQFELIFRIVTKNKKIKWVWEKGVFVTPAKDEVFLEGIVQDISEQKEAERALNNSRAQLRELNIYMQNIREKERTEISREIHDVLGQALTALKFDLSWIKKHSLVKEEPILNKYEQMDSLIDDTTKSVQRISTELRPGLLDDLGLNYALEWQCVEFEKRTEIVTRLNILPENIVLNEQISVILFRIVQEALTNVARHSQATFAEIILQQLKEEVILIIKDNGIGIDMQIVEDPKSLGLLGMSERLYPVDGTISFSGKKNKGTIITIKIPLTTQEAV